MAPTRYPEMVEVSELSSVVMPLLEETPLRKMLDSLLSLEVPIMHDVLFEMHTVHDPQQQLVDIPNLTRYITLP